MNPEDEYRLSFYKDLGDLDSSHDVKLVRHTETGNIYVRKDLKDYDLAVFGMLLENRFEGIPRIEMLADDEETGVLTVIEEFINGRTLRSILDQKGTLPADQTASVLCAICDVLSPLHSNVPPIIHRDIKPENIIITDDSELYIVDFDASKLYSEGKSRDTELIGTRRYAAPEQYGFSQSDPRTDIYAIGKVGREMMTGSPDTTQDQHFGTMYAVLDKCTNMDPENRYRTVSDLRQALSPLLPVGSKQRKTKPASFGRFNDKSDEVMSEITKIHMTSPLPPGFRTGTPWKIAVAIIGYIAIIASAIQFYIDNVPGYPEPLRIAYTVSAVLVMFLWILLFGNYLGIASRLPMTSSKNKVIKCIGYFVYMILIMLVFSVILTVFGMGS